MNLVFVSNYYTHHQAPFCEKMYELLDGNFYFIETERIENERVAMGWQSISKNFIITYFEEPARCYDLIISADVMIYGNCPTELIKCRIKTGKITFAYSERIYKKRFDRWKLPKYIFTVNHRFPNCSNLFLLCASAFAPYDFSHTHTFLDKCYKWGYFPEFIRHDNLDELLSDKDHGVVSILFVSRLISWKHPELPILAAQKLKEEGVSFHLTMIGIGDMETQIVNMIKDNSLDEEVTLIKTMSTTEVRTYMDKSSIFLFPSDRNEGWGAVLNESMNSACAVVASSEIGSVPYLIDNGKNGCVFQDGNFEDFYSKVKELCLNQDLREKYSVEAYKTVEKNWNADNAANRLLHLISDLDKTGYSDRFAFGPCSKAQMIKDGWFDGNKI